MKQFFLLAAIILQVCLITPAALAQAYTRIISPAQGQCVPGPDVRVQFEAGGVTLAPGGYSLHFKLNDEPFHVHYRGNYAHVFRNVPPGSHTVRMYLANSLHEAVPGTLSTVTFNVAHYDGANLITPHQPYLTWNLPQGEYIGADATDITLDFLLTNATLSPGGYQVAYYVNGRRFLIQDNCWRRHIKNLEPGLHRIRIELQDANGDLIPGAFNSGERIIAVNPYSTEPTAPVSADAYWNAPRIHSIPGRATMGGARPVLPRTLTATEIERQASLTINRQGRQLRLDGSVISEDITPGRRPDLDEPIPSAVPEGFTVREGGTPDPDVTDLDTLDSDNVIRGSVVVRPGATSTRSEPETEAESLHEDSEEAGEAGTTAARADDDDPDPTVTEETDNDDEPTTAPSVRRRADGSIVRVERTTETLRLSDRPTLRQSTIETTRTVTGAGITTGTTDTDDDTTVVIPRRRNSRTTTTATGASSAPVVTGATPAPATSLTGTADTNQDTEADAPGQQQPDGIIGDDDSDDAEATPTPTNDNEDADTDRTVRDRTPRREQPADEDDEEARSTRGRREGNRTGERRRRSRRESNTTREGYRPPVVAPQSDR